MADINNQKTANSKLIYPLLRAGNFYYILSMSHIFRSTSTITPETLSSLHQETAFGAIIARFIFSLCANVLGYAIVRTILPVNSAVESFSLSEIFHLECIHCSTKVFFSEFASIFYSQNNPILEIIRHLSEKHCTSCPSRAHIQAFLSEQVSQPTEEGDYSFRQAGN